MFKKIIFWNLPFLKSVWPWIWPWTNGPRSNMTKFSESPYVNYIGLPILHKPLGPIFPCQKWTSLVILTLFFVKIVNIFLKIRYLSYWKTVFSYVIYRGQSVQEKLIRLFGWKKNIIFRFFENGMFCGFNGPNDLEKWGQGQIWKLIWGFWAHVWGGL